MKDVFVRKLKMYRNVQSVLTARKPIWENFVPFVTTAAGLDALTGNIDAKSNEFKGSKSLSKEKEQASLTMRTAALVICGAGSAYASMQKDDGLKEKFNFSKSELKKGNEIEIYSRCLSIAKAAEPILQKLVDFNMPGDQITVLNDAAAAFNALLSAPRSVIKSDKSTNEELEKLFRECDVLLNDQIDKMMLTFENSQADFYTEYTNARAIGGWGKGKKEMKGEGVIDNS
jgi:hypothetical protein